MEHGRSDIEVVNIAQVGDQLLLFFGHKSLILSHVMQAILAIQPAIYQSHLTKETEKRMMRRIPLDFEIGAGDAFPHDLVFAIVRLPTIAYHDKSLYVKLHFRVIDRLAR